MNHQQAPSSIDHIRVSVTVIAFACRALALSVEVFLHRVDSFGERYIGLQSALACLIMLLFPAFCEPGNDPEFMYIYLAWYLFMTLCIRARIQIRRSAGGAQPHSYYTGRPLLMGVLRRTSEHTIKTLVEPVLVFLVGTFVIAFNAPLGAYLMLASAGLLVTTKLTADHEQRRSVDMNDAYIDQRNAAERFRSRRGD
ncbi:MAG: hypothetical protein KF768_11915 [Phycisphaeraceae bacterium]|nr:hypothetical protein [Phycisphaeraceae bacterium]